MTTTIDAMISYTKNEWHNPGNRYFWSVVSTAKERNVQTFVDLGACLGEVSKCFLENVPSLKKIFAIEAIPKNYNFLKENLKSDTCEIVYVNKAIYYGIDKVSMGTLLSNIGGFGIREEGLFDKSQYEQVHEDLETYTLESVLGDEKIDFLKMDIEGAENNIITNSSALKNIGLIEIEFHEYSRGLPNGSFRSMLDEHLPNHQIIDSSYQGIGGNNVLLALK